MSIRLSTFIPNYNHGRYLESAFAGLMAQDRPPDEIIVYDDGSSDDSVEIIRRLQRRWPLIRLVEGGVNRGAMYAGRKGLELISGDWVNLLAADDTPLPGYYAAAVQMAEANPTAGIICGKMRVVHETTGAVSVVGVDQWTGDQYVSPERFLREYMYAAAPNHSLGAGTLWRREALLEAGGFREELLSWCDTFAARSIALRYGACYIARPVVQVGYSETCYSARIARDTQTMLQIINTAVDLMRSDAYRDRFPEDYVLKWKRDYLLLLQELQVYYAAQERDA